MDDPHEILIPNVTPEQLAQLREILCKDGGVVTPTGENAGLVENTCFATKFQYDSGSKLLTLEPHRLVRTLTPRRLRKYVQALIAPPASLDAAGDKPKPTPFSCATYNWTIAFYTNNSGGVLTFSDQDTSAGNLSVPVSKVNPGDQFSTYPDGCWVNKETKDATNGCAGSVSFQLADGQTTLKIDYYVNTAMPNNATAALKGQNAARYVASVENGTEWNGGKATTYQYLYITINKAT
jgi:hypothetical protein